MRIDVDATQVKRRLVHAHIEIPVSGTSVTLSYPLWSPGDHAPLQHVGQIGSLFFQAKGAKLAWKRNLVDQDELEVHFPQGTSRINAEFDVLLPVPGEPLADSSENIFVLRWNLYVLYVAGQPVSGIPVEASAIFPKDWQSATSLTVEQQDSETLHFRRTSLETLVDSPVLAGRYMRKIDIPSEPNVSHEMDVAAETEDNLPEKSLVAQQYGRLVAQGHLLFGGEHYRQYKFLVAASDYTAPGGGIEHHESSDNRVPGGFFRKPRYLVSMGDLLPHEYAHSWNGKYRCPEDLYAIDYQKPEKTDLLWVYESLTDYLGLILAARSGFESEEDVREHWAALAAKVDHETGRTWRNMQDTANSVPLTMQELFLAPPGWDSWIRVLDYYDEGALLWLEADQIIVQRTQGRRSLDDFVKLFYSGSNGFPSVKTYTEPDVLTALNQIAPFDWKGFFHQRLTSHSPHAPLSGLEEAGWRLSYTARPNTYITASRPNGLGATMYSIGLATGSDGVVSDVLRGGPCDAEGIVPGMKVTAVNGEPWSTAALLASIVETTSSTKPIRLQFEIGGVLNNVDVSYHGGPRYPHLERIRENPDRLTVLLNPLR